MQTAEENYLFVGASTRPVITTSGEDIRAVSWTLALGRVLAPYLKIPNGCVIGVGARYCVWSTVIKPTDEIRISSVQGGTSQNEASCYLNPPRSRQGSTHHEYLLKAVAPACLPLYSHYPESHGGEAEA